MSQEAMVAGYSGAVLGQCGEARDLAVVCTQGRAVFKPSYGTIGFQSELSDCSYTGHDPAVAGPDSLLWQPGFPRMEYRGSIVDYEPGMLEQDGIYPVYLLGDLSLHGAMNQCKWPARVIVLGDFLRVEAEGSFLPMDHNIRALPRQAVNIHVSAVFVR